MALSVFSADVIEVKVRALDGFGGDTSSVASRCQTKVGKTYDAVTVSRDVAALKDSGEFEEINAEAKRVNDGVEVTFFIRRKVRFAAPLAVKGCEFFSESKVAKESELKDGYLYGEADLAAAAEKVRLAYQKKYYSDAKVVPLVEVSSGNDATITFMVEEGARRKVAKYAFEGADHAVEAGIMPWSGMKEGEFDRALLREAISDFPWWNPVGWFSDGPVTVDQLAQCCSKIAEVYRNCGYLDVKVTGPDRVPLDSGEVEIRFKVDEGVQYRVGNISIIGLTRYSESDVAAKSELPRRGELAGEKSLNEAAHRISVAVGSGDSGLADTRVDLKRIPSESDSKSLDIVFKVTEGVPVAINEVEIRGNDYTQDKVIRREIALGPGDRMLADRAERSRKRLENLDYFSRVRYYLEPTGKGLDANGAELRNLVYEVEEKNTGSFMVGVGASSVDSVYVSAEINQNNFDIFAPSKMFRGAGQKGRAYVAWGPRYQSMELGFTEPHLFGRYLELNVDAYRRLRWYDEYDLIRSGGMGSLTYPVKFWPSWGAFGRLGVGISGEYIEFDDVEGGRYVFENKNVSFAEEEKLYGDAFEPVLHLFWAKDSRDNFRMPKNGHRTRLFVDLAPGGDNEYWRLGVNHRSYFDLFKDLDHILMVGLRAETIDGFSDEVPIYNRMFLGGPKSIRGIEYRHISPMARRENSSEWVPWGGQTLFCMNFEYTVPVIKMFRVAAFSDLGSVGVDEFDLDFSDTFAWTVGIGLRVDIPMFPIRLDFGVPIEKPDHAEKEVFSFTIGYDF